MTFIELLNAYNIMPQFPPGAVKQAEKMPDRVSDKDLQGREDLTDKLIITIDGDDAKDFDDAVSLEMLENNNYLLGVHIADVSHYVTENSSIDRAAFSRGTSVYLIDTVIPMLPFELSNELCSLKPDEIRLTLSVFMEITPRGRVADYRISESYIKSHDRMTYENVTKILDGNKELTVKYSHLTDMLKKMKKLADILRKKRVSRGAIEFTTHESKITLDKNGKPIKVERYPITVSNGIIEEFMLICNETVAKHLFEKKLPCVFRVHEKPDFVRIERLGEVLPVLGVDFEYSSDMKPKDFQKLLKSAEGMESFDVVNYLVLRTMSKAKYSEKNMGHFGLAAANYCHFTSPIRRYPDLAVHRVLKESLRGEISDSRIDKLKEFVISASVSSSVSEVNAQDAEIAWKNVKKAEYMKDKVGEKYKGVITHVTSSGFFVELENTVEGFVAARTVEDDVYIISDSGVSLVGLKNKRHFTVGMTVEVKVVLADVENNRVDFEVTANRLLAPQRRKGKHAAAGKKLTKENKRIFKEVKAESREARRMKHESRDKADFERAVFENAFTYVFLEAIGKIHSFKRTEKGFLGVTLSDTAAMVILPLYRSYLYENDGFKLKECLISAGLRVDFMLSTLEESFGFECGDAFKKFAAEYVRASMRHFDACMKHDEINRLKREHEYDALAAKLQKRIMIKN